MFPGGINPRQMKSMMKRMGIKMDEIDADTVIIKSTDKEIVIEDPQVIRTIVQGQGIFQVSGGKIVEREIDVEIPIENEDIEMVAKQTGVSREEAKRALEESRGDIASAIMKIKG